MKYLLAIDRLEYDPTDTASVRFDRAIRELASYKMPDWNSTFKVVICEDLEAGMSILREDVRKYLRGNFWWEEAYAHRIKVHASFSDIDNFSRCWLIPNASNSLTCVRLVDVTP